MESKITAEKFRTCRGLNNFVFLWLLLAVFGMPQSRAGNSTDNFYSNTGADVVRFSKHVGKTDTIRGWLGIGKSGLIVIEDKTHAEIGIDPLVCPRGGEVVQKFTWTGWMSYRTEYPLGGMPSKQDYKRLCKKIDALKKTYNVWDKTPFVTVTGTVCRLKTITTGLENHRRCSMPMEHFFFCADDVRVSPLKR